MMKQILLPALALSYDHFMQCIPRLAELSQCNHHRNILQLTQQSPAKWCCLLLSKLPFLSGCSPPLLGSLQWNFFTCLSFVSSSFLLAAVLIMASYHTILHPAILQPSSSLSSMLLSPMLINSLGSGNLFSVSHCIALVVTTDWCKTIVCNTHSHPKLDASPKVHRFIVYWQTFS